MDLFSSHRKFVNAEVSCPEAQIMLSSESIALSVPKVWGITVYLGSDNPNVYSDKPQVGQS